MSCFLFLYTEAELRKLGFQTIDRAFFDKDPMNKVMLWERVFCLRCKRNRRICTCGPFRKFVELDPIGEKHFPISARENIGLNINPNDKKPAFEAILSKEFENHAYIKEKHQQKLKDIKSKMRSVEEVDEEIIREEIIDLLKDVISEDESTDKECSNDMNKDLSKVVVSKRNFDASHEDNDKTFNGKESTDKVDEKNEAQILSDEKKDKIEGEELVQSVDVNENGELRNLKDIKEKQNGKILKMNELQVNENVNLTEEPCVCQNGEAMEVSDKKELGTSVSLIQEKEFFKIDFKR